jgi:hypothetical protein
MKAEILKLLAESRLITARLETLLTNPLTDDAGEYIPCRRKGHSELPASPVSIGNFRTALCPECINEWTHHAMSTKQFRRGQQLHHLMAAAKSIGDYESVVKWDDEGNELELWMFEEVKRFVESEGRAHT